MYMPSYARITMGKYAHCTQDSKAGQYAGRMADLIKISDNSRKEHGRYSVPCEKAAVEMWPISLNRHSTGKVITIRGASYLSWECHRAIRSGYEDKTSKAKRSSDRKSDMGEQSVHGIQVY